MTPFKPSKQTKRVEEVNHMFGDADPADLEILALSQITAPAGMAKTTARHSTYSVRSMSEV